MNEREQRASADVIARRDAVRIGVQDALAQEVDLTGRRTASRLAIAGGLGLATAIVAIALFARRGASVDALYLAVCAAMW